MNPTLAPFIPLIRLVTVLAVLLGLAIAYDGAASQRALEDHPAPGRFVEVGGTDVHVICRGETEPTLVLLHGYGGGAIDWLPLMNELSPRTRVCAIDRPGSDYSSTMTGDVEGVLSVLHAAITTMGSERPVVVGHSLGGAFAMRYAATHPVAGLILVDGLSPDVADRVTTRLGTYASLAPLAKLGLLRPMAGSFVHPSYEWDLRAQMVSLRSRASAITAIAVEGRLAREGLNTASLLDAEAGLQAPLLVLVAGVPDVPEGEAFAQSLHALATRIPTSTLRVVPEAGHYLMSTHAAHVAAEIETWLADIAATARAAAP